MNAACTQVCNIISENGNHIIICYVILTMYTPLKTMDHIRIISSLVFNRLSTKDREIYVCKCSCAMYQPYQLHRVNVSIPLHNYNIIHKFKVVH